MQKPYQNALVFSGGGMRFGYYIGVYQAFFEKFGVPDVILSSCGGSLATAILHSTSNPKMAYHLLKSHACYQMCCRLYAKKPPSRLTYLMPALKRWLAFQTHQLKPSGILHAVNKKEQDALFVSLFGVDGTLWQQSSFDETLASMPPDLTSCSPIKSLVIASCLGNDGRWQEFVRSSCDTLAQTLTATPMTCALSHYNPQRINPKIQICSAMPLPVALQASISDMYYMSPLVWQGEYFLGGVLDLTPVELAGSLARQVFIDDKIVYDSLLARPAIWSCFGFDPSQRLYDVKQKYCGTDVHWLPLADNRHHTISIIQKHYNWWHGYIQGVYPDFADFQKIVHKQWHYGYQRTKIYLASI